MINILQICKYAYGFLDWNVISKVFPRVSHPELHTYYVGDSWYGGTFNARCSTAKLSHDKHFDHVQ